MILFKLTRKFHYYKSMSYEEESMILFCVFTVTKAKTVIYRSSQTDCATCPLKAKCCPNTPNRKIVRSIHEAARDVARRIAKTPEYLVSRCERKKVEMLFAHLKRIMKLDRLRLRGLTGATDEFTLAAMVQNLRRMAKLLPQGPPLTG
jgi:hypothetical protein